MVKRFAAMEAELAGLKALCDELRNSRDDWKAQAERATIVLAAPAQTAARSWIWWRRRV
jgi:hypothetical protein